MNAYLKPWKLITLGLGLTALIFGAEYYEFPDWDIGISIIMSVMTYIFAPYTVQNILKRPIIALFVCWISVDFSYVFYNYLNHVDISNLRLANIYASFPVYLILGIIWSIPERVK